MSVAVVECWVAPDVPVMVTVYVPAGVPEAFAPLGNPPLQPLMKAVSPTSSANATGLARRIGFLRANTKQRSAVPRASEVNVKLGGRGLGNVGNVVASVLAVVVMVSVELADSSPGETDGGLKLAV